MHRPISRYVMEYRWNKRLDRFLGSPAPLFEGTTVAGERWRLASHKGSVVVIEFGAAWCAPCIGAYPILRSLRTTYADRTDFAVVGVSLDSDVRALSEHLELHNIDWPVLHEEGRMFDNSIARLYEVNTIPSIWVIDQDGKVALVDGSLDAVPDVVKELLE